MTARALRQASESKRAAESDELSLRISSKAVGGFNRRLCLVAHTCHVARSKCTRERWVSDQHRRVRLRTSIRSRRHLSHLISRVSRGFDRWQEATHILFGRFVPGPLFEPARPRLHLKAPRSGSALCRTSRDRSKGPTRINVVVSLAEVWGPTSANIFIVSESGHLSCDAGHKKLLLSDSPTTM